MPQGASPGDDVFVAIRNKQQHIGVMWVVLSGLAVAEAIRCALP